MLDLDRVEQLLSRLMIRHRDDGISVPFILNPNQKNAMKQYKKWVVSGKPLRVICVKSRRVGFSKLSDGILFAHALSNPLAADLIVAHQYKSSVDLFQDPATWAKTLPFALPDATKQIIKFNHTKGESTLKVATAGSVSSGRGLTLSGLHLSEAAYYPGQDSFTSLLPTVSSKDPNSIITIESTANGKTGPGEIFYEYWQAACEGKNGYLAVFLSFLDDPGCIREEEEAEDAPASDIERELMGKPYHASKAKIAWYRHTMESLCHGQEDTMLQEYPHNAEVAFLTSGDPAFSRDELILAHKEIIAPKLVGQIEMCGDAKAEFQKARGPWHLWEVPDGNSWYFFGVDAARGIEHGDFGVIKIINGHTGKCAARLAERLDPERLAVLLYAAIHYYGLHPCTVNIELTGNLGWVIQKALRDGRKDLGIRAISHVLHSWKPTRDDRQPGKSQSNALGWETTYRSRERMIIAFRAAIRSKRCILLDELCVKQMENAERSGHLYDFEVKRGHDDVFMGHMLSWICREDHPPPRIGGIRTWSPEDDRPNDGLPMDIRAGESTAEGCIRSMLAKHQKIVESAIQKADTPSLLEGI
jgi:hypothetical protein